MNVLRLYNTIKYLKSEQLYYRVYYRLRNILRNKVGFRYSYFRNSNPNLLNWKDYVFKNTSYLGKNRFVFLNKEKFFKNKIDWNFKKYGKLWTYNLNYFDFLNQKDIHVEEGLRLIYDFIANIENIKDGLEPYPISLRGINWIKFLSKNRIGDKKVNNCLYAQYYILLNNLEYHLLGNHLLENGFSLLFGACYFKDEKLYEKAKEILLKELNEQILSDGAHFELSPMYHQIILERILDSINLLQNNEWEDKELLEFLEEKAKLMLSWLNNVTFSNGSIPLFNDSAFNVVPTTKDLLEYASNLSLEFRNVPLGESGYRFIRKEKYEMAIDIADVKASYIPGHTHADTFTFELYVNNRPIVVDTGISTYENSERRLLERSTKAHNSVEIESTSSSEVWGSFRLGDRAYVRDVLEKENYIKAIHNGYFRKYKVFHQREFFFKENSIIIRDKLIGNRVKKAIARLHFHPDVKVKLIDGMIVINEEIRVKFNVPNVLISNYYYAPEFNKLLPAKVVEVSFIEGLECRIEI